MDRFVLQKSSEKTNHWVCTDTENMIVCTFRNKKFNETQKVTFINDLKQIDALKVARIMREMSDWLANNHYEKCM